MKRGQESPPMASKMAKTPELSEAKPPGASLGPTGALEWVPGPHTEMLTHFAHLLVHPAPLNSNKLFKLAQQQNPQREHWT